MWEKNSLMKRAMHYGERSKPIYGTTIQDEREELEDEVFIIIYLIAAARTLDTALQISGVTKVQINCPAAAINPI